MRKLLIQFSDLVIMLAAVVLLFTAGRAYFFFSFQPSFEAFTNSQLINAFLSGFEYDLKVVLMVNSIFILLFFIPTKIYNSSFYLSVLKFTYFTANSVALLFNVLDINSFNYYGKRISIVNIKSELVRMFNDLIDLNFGGSIKTYLILLIFLIIIIIVLKSLLDLIQRRDFETKKIKQTFTATCFLILGLYGWFSYSFINDKGTWLIKLYQKADRKLAPLVMNNPYMFLSSAASGLPAEHDYWDQVVFQSENRYDSIASLPLKHICLVFIDNNDSILSSSNENVTKRVFQFSVLSSGFQTAEKYLNEALLSFPSIFPYEFYQSVYSLNDFECLPQLLGKRSFESNLFTIGYTKKQLKLLKNFHGFKNARQLDTITNNEDKLISSIIGNFDADSVNKTFDVILIRQAGKSISETIVYSYLRKIKNNGLAFVFNIPDNHGQNVSLIKSMKLYLPDNQITYCPFNDIIQCLDIKPSILHYLNTRINMVAYGSSLFTCNANSIFTSNGPDNFYLLKDSLLLNYSSNETKGLFLLRNKKILKEDFKDSLAVEKIDMENRIHSIFQDFEYRTENNKLKSEDLLGDAQLSCWTN